MKPSLNANFFRSDGGNEPVREWLKTFPAAERRIMGEDIKTVQFGWPLEGSTMVIIHGFIKKQQTTPKQDLDLAKERIKILKRK